MVFSSFDRRHSYCAALCGISVHPIFNGWLTSVCIQYRPIRDDEGPQAAYHLGLGRDISQLRNLNTLRILGLESHIGGDGAIQVEDQSEIMNVLIDMIAAPETPPVRNLSMSFLISDGAVVSRLIEKFKITLRELVLDTVELKPGEWNACVLPTIANCALQYLLIDRPRISSLEQSKNESRKDIAWSPKGPDAFCEYVHETTSTAFLSHNDLYAWSFEFDGKHVDCDEEDEAQLSIDESWKLVADYLRVCKREEIHQRRRTAGLSFGR